MSVINKVLIKDADCRYEGIADDLHVIKTLNSDKILDYDLPTIVSKNFDYNQSIKLCTDIKIFKATFYKKYPFLTGLCMDNLLIAGGSISDIIRNRNSRSSDIDFFVWGLTLDEANIRIDKWIRDVINCAKAYIDRKSKTGKKNMPKVIETSDSETDSDKSENGPNTSNINYESELNC